MATTLVATISLNLKDKWDKKDKFPNCQTDTKRADTLYGFSLTAPSVHQKPNPRESTAFQFTPKGKIESVRMGLTIRRCNQPTRRQLMAYIQERKTGDGKPHYRVQVRLKGFPVTSATFGRKTDAKQTEAAMRAKKHTLGELVERYIATVIPIKPRNAAACTGELLWWKKQLGHCLLADLSPSLIAQKRDILRQGVTPQGKLRSPYGNSYTTGTIECEALRQQALNRG